MAYPVFRVIISYLLFGSLIGVSPLLFFMIPTSLDEVKDSGMTWVLGLGYILGLVPALITGVILACAKVRILSVWDYIKPLSIGFLATFIYTLLVGFYTELFRPEEDGNLLIGWLICLVISGGMGLLGAMAAAVLARLVLPKS